MNLSIAFKHFEQDPRLYDIIKTVEMPDFNPTGRIYYNLLDSIISQQLSVKVANVIFNRFINLFPDQNPDPQLLLGMSVDQLRAVGVSNQKATYLQHVATFAIEHDMDSIQWSELSDEAIIKLLTQIKGVGTWTVQMLLMFSLGRPDVFPVDDLGIQQAMCKLYNLDPKDKNFKKTMISLSTPWQPYRTIASRYLWRWKDSIK